MHDGLTLEDVTFLGRGLRRPECLVTHASGVIFASDWTGSGGVAIVGADGSVSRILAKRAAEDPLRPNGIALEPGGSFLVAHLGEETGGLLRLFPDGEVEPVLVALDGEPLPPSNFPVIDRSGRVWLTISTRVRPRAKDYRSEASTGFIVLVDKTGARIVADGLGYANECALSADEKTLFVNETFARRVTRFAIEADGSLSGRATVAEFGPGTFPDGLVLDAEDHLWVTSIVSNRVIRISPDGRSRAILEESDAGHLLEVERAFASGCMGRPHLDGSPARTLRNVSSLAFGGPALETAYLGCLLGDRIVAFEPGVRGRPHPSYFANLGPILPSRTAS
jgi:sugar lactone lactonase YvrE